MPELNMISPLLTNMELVKCVSVHGGTSVYIVKSTKSNQSYYLKHICIPESQKQVDALMFTGAAATVEDAQNYYKQVAADYQSELETLEKLSASPNIGCYRSYQIEPKEDGVGFEIYLLAEYRQTLSEVLAETPMTQSGAVNLGLDLCSALCSLREAGLIHRNVKPSNVYLSSSGHYLLGDLGIAKIDELKYCSMPENMLSSFSAPELFSLLGTIEPTTDIYSVGMILYRIYNGNHGPFEDEKTSARAADKLRVTGQQLPAPMYADYEMADILLKACAFKPEDRYQTPQELQEALLEYGKRNEASDALIVPPIEGEPEQIDPSAEEEVEPVQFADTEQMADDFKESFSPDTAMLNAIIDEVHRGEAGQNTLDLDENSQDASEDDADNSSSSEDAEVDELKINLPPRGQRRKKKASAPKWILPVFIGAAALAAIAAAVWFFVIVPSVTHVNSVSVTDIGTDYLTVQVESGEDSGAFDVTCSDAYGNQSRKAFTAGEAMTFDSLVPGTQYTIEAVPLEGKKMTGSYSATASTYAETKILSFTATPISITQAELNFILQDGPDFDSWTLSYAAEGAEAKTVTFPGHSAALLFCIVIGLPLGIWLARSPRAAKIIRPLLDAMQTTPAFVYLVPIVMLFGIGNVPGVVVTIIFALPPIIRLTILGINQVPADLIEASRSFGASPRQMLFKVQLPLAMPTIMAIFLTDLVGNYSITVVAINGNTRTSSSVNFMGIEWSLIGEGYYTAPMFGVTDMPVQVYKAGHAEWYKMPSIFEDGKDMVIKVNGASATVDQQDVFTEPTYGSVYVAGSGVVENGVITLTLQYTCSAGSFGTFNDVLKLQKRILNRGNKISTISLDQEIYGSNMRIENIIADQKSYNRPEYQLRLNENKSYYLNKIEKASSSLERKIFDCFMKGYKSKEIAELLNIDIRCVYNAKYRLQKKMDKSK